MNNLRPAPIRATSVRKVYSSMVRSRNKREEWREIIDRVYAPLEIDLTDAMEFRGEIRTTTLSRVGIAEIETDGESASRTRSHIGKDTEAHFFLTFGQSGRSWYSQHGRECIVGPAQYTLLYSAAPYVFDHRDRVRLLTVKLPAAALASRVSDPHSLCGIAATVAPGFLSAVADLIATVADPSYPLSDTRSAIVEESLLDLLALGLVPDTASEARDGTSVRWAIHRRAVAYMKENLACHDLSPAQIAAATGVSARYVHRIFESADETVCECLARLRLERSHADLSNGAKNPMSIKEIAVGNGFKSQSHFSSLFRARFGVTPRDFRQAARS